MQRASESIKDIATALAKAQAELENPEKSLTATIASPFAREAPRSFRYASLASGLEIVRKCLTKHGIATVQATSIEPDTLIKLTTTLLHTSGEWIASDWPVCPVSETAAPHRLGAALTYARRYALFTLVGIAGEDDLDAPDLPAAGLSPEVQTSSVRPEHGFGSPGPRGRPLPASGKRGERVRLPTLPADASDNLRRRLISELENLNDPEALASWAERALPLKNQLTVADAQGLEAGFAARLAQLSGPGSQPESASLAGKAYQASDSQSKVETVTVINKPVRERDRNHLRFVSSQACLVCGRTPSDAHHLKFAEQRAIGRKVSDRFTVPICRLHHRELHRARNEVAWWDSKEIDSLAIAASLWERTHAVDV